MKNINEIKASDKSSVITVFLTFLRLGLTSFGVRFQPVDATPNL